MRRSFKPIFPIESSPGEFWIEWFEALFCNSYLLIRCIPYPNFVLPENATSIMLNFGRVAAFRGTECPFDLTAIDPFQELPRMENGRLQSHFALSSASSWIERASKSCYDPIFHFVMCSGSDQILEILSFTSNPSIHLENNTGDPAIQPTQFSVEGVTTPLTDPSSGTGENKHL